MSQSDPQKVSRGDCRPWQDAKTVRHFYKGKGYSLLETGETLGCAECTVSQWCDRHDIETRDAQEARDPGTPKELKDESWLRREYLDKERTCSEIADEVGASDKCVSDWLNRHDIPTRSRNRRRNRVDLTCQNCGDGFEAIQSHEDKRKYCSRECYYAAMDMPTGEDHWSWRGTPEHRPSGVEWTQLREEVRERDGYECRLCGAPESDMDRELDVHHLERVRDADDPRAATEIDADNMVALCRSCHRRVERYAPLLPPSLE